MYKHTQRGNFEYPYKISGDFDNILLTNTNIGLYYPGKRTQKGYRMSLNSWIENVKNLFKDRKQLKHARKAYFYEKNRIFPLDFKDRMPNHDLENRIYKSACGIVYCPEVGFLLEDDSDSVINKCDRFCPTGPRCTNKYCQAYKANHEYFNAADEYNNAKTQYNNAIRRVFGLKQR